MILIEDEEHPLALRCHSTVQELSDGVRDEDVRRAVELLHCHTLSACQALRQLIHGEGLPRAWWRHHHDDAGIRNLQEAAQLLTEVSRHAARGQLLQEVAREAPPEEGQKPCNIPATEPCRGAVRVLCDVAGLGHDNTRVREIRCGANRGRKHLRCKREIAPVPVLREVPRGVDVLEEDEAPGVVPRVLGQPLQERILHDLETLDVDNASEAGEALDDVEVHPVNAHRPLRDLTLEVAHCDVLLAEELLELEQRPTPDHVHAVALLPLDEAPDRGRDASTSRSQRLCEDAAEELRLRRDVRAATAKTIGNDEGVHARPRRRLRVPTRRLNLAEDPCL
mmetsp:Transcript_25915/g.56558  ORF Transcript_25915/g.56558 Transcript_25915/m.56558 type:complete len:337 (+) Transcript_25915:2002-3012(+)